MPKARPGCLTAAVVTCAGLSRRGHRRHHGTTTPLWSMGAACSCLVRQQQAVLGVVNVLLYWFEKKNERSLGSVKDLVQHQVQYFSWLTVISTLIWKYFTVLFKVKMIWSSLPKWFFRRRSRGEVSFCSSPLSKHFMQSKVSSNAMLGSVCAPLPGSLMEFLLSRWLYWRYLFQF